jgi:hypothetical protein
MYAKQVPIARALPLWGGVSADGFASVLIHPTKKVQVEEWVECVENNKLKQALGAINPMNKRGPWSVLCDNEGFLHSAAVKKAHKGARVKLWHIVNFG